MTPIQIETFTAEVLEAFNRLQPCDHLVAFIAGAEFMGAKWQETNAAYREAIGKTTTTNLWGDEEEQDHV